MLLLSRIFYCHAYLAMVNYLRKWLPNDSNKKEDNLVPPQSSGRRQVEDSHRPGLTGAMIANRYVVEKSERRSGAVRALWREEKLKV